MFIFPNDEVLEYAAEAASNNSSEVHRALSDYVRENDERAGRALRSALVTQAAGHESCAHDGCTSLARKEAAAAALSVWRAIERREVGEDDLRKVADQLGELFPAYTEKSEQEVATAQRVLRHLADLLASERPKKGVST